MLTESQHEACEGMTMYFEGLAEPAQIGRRLQNMREARGLSHGDLAAQATALADPYTLDTAKRGTHITEGDIIQFETGRFATLAPDDLVRLGFIAAALKTPLSRLVFAEPPQDCRSTHAVIACDSNMMGGYL
jgi:transcriptional regulator with XRE-family HTH domain